MTIPFTVHSDALDKFTHKGVERVQRKLMLLDASTGSRLDQIVELNLPPEHPPVGVGKVITVEISEFSQIFSGRPRIRGNVVEPSRTPVAPSKP